jgi:hypothetical protein
MYSFSINFTSLSESVSSYFFLNILHRIASRINSCIFLSLAPALSERSSGRSWLESLFLDEGFGTLDSEILDVVMNALESLRLSGRTIGVIGHID